MNYCIATTDGRIYKTGFCIDGQESVQEKDSMDDQLFLFCTNPKEHYISNGVLKDRIDPGLSFFCDGLVCSISNIPGPGWIDVVNHGDRLYFPANEPLVDFIAPYPGFYDLAIFFNNPMYKDFKYGFQAVDE